MLLRFKVTCTSSKKANNINLYNKERHVFYVFRCRLLCCCILGDEQSKDAFDEISNLLADFFQVCKMILIFHRCIFLTYLSQLLQLPYKNVNNKCYKRKIP